MDIKISNAGGVPIYEQIVTQIKAKIIAGELREGDALPSMRLLAKELRISVITTKRAYEELEREGFIVSMTGKGIKICGIPIIRSIRNATITPPAAPLPPTLTPKISANNTYAISAIANVPTIDTITHIQGFRYVLFNNMLFLPICLFGAYCNQLSFVSQTSQFV